MGPGHHDNLLLFSQNQLQSKLKEYYIYDDIRGITQKYFSDIE